MANIEGIIEEVKLASREKINAYLSERKKSAFKKSDKKVSFEQGILANLQLKRYQTIITEAAIRYKTCTAEEQKEIVKLLTELRDNNQIRYAKDKTNITAKGLVDTINLFLEKTQNKKKTTVRK